MGDVVAIKATRFQADDGTAPHLSGQAICGWCAHEWAAVGPLGVDPGHLECPSCHRMWGAFKNAVEPAETWTCNCGEWLFWLTPKGAMCRRCGVISSDWAE